MATDGYCVLKQVRKHDKHGKTRFQTSRMSGCSMLFHAIPQICLISPVIERENAPRTPDGFHLTWLDCLRPLWAKGFMRSRLWGILLTCPFCNLSCFFKLSFLPYYNLVGGLEQWFLFFHILGIIIPTDFHIFQRGWKHQPAIYYMHFCWSFSMEATWSNINLW